MARKSRSDSVFVYLIFTQILFKQNLNLNECLFYGKMLWEMSDDGDSEVMMLS